MTPPCKIRNPEYIGSWTDGLVIRFVIQNVIHPAPPVFGTRPTRHDDPGVFTLEFRDFGHKKTATRTVNSKWWWEMDVKKAYLF